jgi:hypothetical protein
VPAPGFVNKAVKLYGRSLTLTIGFPNDPALDVKARFNEKNSGGFDTGGIAGLDVEFLIEKSLKAAEPNTAKIEVFNLSPESRQRVSGKHALTVKLEAGYEGGTSQLYFAECRSGWTTREQADYVTHIESTDTIARPTGVRTTRKAQPGSATGNLYRTMGARVPIATAFQAIATAMGVGVGNLNQALAGKPLPLTAVNGGAIVGNAAQRMTDICRSAGLEWSIVDGNLQLLNIGQALTTVEAIEINDRSGLVGSPSVDSQGAVSLTTLLIPGLNPGVLLKLDTLFVTGGFRIEKIRFQGGTREKEWYAHMDASRF